MIDSSIGYIICESDISPQVANVTGELNGKAIGEGILQTADERNRNGRYYEEEELFPQLTAPRTVELLRAGYLRAETGHPLSKDLQRQSTIDDTKTCARFLKLWTVGKDVWATFTATNNQYGKAFDMDLKEGCLPAWSLRALGTLQKSNVGMKVKNLRLITWDNVIYPSHPGAYTQRLLSESAAINESTAISENEKNDVAGEAMIIPITNDNIISYIQAESANLKFVKECLDFAYSAIAVNESGTKVLLTTKEGETLGINMESYIHQELMRYADQYSRFREM